MAKWKLGLDLFMLAAISLPAQIQGDLQDDYSMIRQYNVSDMIYVCTAVASWHDMAIEN